MATGEAAVDRGADQPDENRALRHDLRNLLAVIINYCELITAETEDPQAIKADIGEIRMAAERAIALTDKIPPRAAHAQGSEPAAEGM